MKIGHKIRQMRIEASMTQEQLAVKLGVSAQSISKWENEISMPDITLLPDIAEVFGISIDELFDLTVEQKLKRIENRIEIEDEFSEQTFKEYEAFLKAQLSESRNRVEVLSLLAKLYHHRMESDSRKVSKYGREAILLDPAKKDCQWLLIKAEGHTIWDWNVANHSSAIDFYKETIKADKITPRTPLPYYYLIDNLLADNRLAEAAHYITEVSKLPSAKPILVEVYGAYLALLKHNVTEANRIIEKCILEHSENSDALFEGAQFYAKQCEYDKAIELYERAWAVEKSPRFTDALQGIATIYKIKGNKQLVSKTYDRLLECLKNEWGYSPDDQPYAEVVREKMLYLKEK